MSTLQVNQRLAAITAAGTSIWLDEIRRGLIESGELRRLVEEDSLRGVTSNPTIFNRAILGSEDYDDQLVELALRGTLTRAIYQELVISDIQQACDVLRDVYEATERYDGYVSLEVDPDLAFDTQRTMQQAREYSERVDRPNLMIKIPGTAEGLPAIEEMIYEGRNINVTLLFAVSEYERVMEAYIRGLERRQVQGEDVDVRSVASFFVSRVDTEVDRRLEDLGRTDLFGRAGLANARAAYRRFTAVFHGERFAALRAAGAPVQRPLWASTQVKNPNYPDTMYVEGLVGPETVNTMPMATLLAAGDHAPVDPARPTVLIDPEPDLRALAEAGIDLDDVTAQLLTEGVEKFVAPFEELMTAIERRREAIAMARPPAIQGSIPDQLEPRIALRVQRAVEEDVARRIWRKDASLWGDPGQPELADRLGWLTVPEQMREEVDELEAFADQIRDEGITDVLLLGMGGSSLAPEVIRRSFGDQDGRPRLRVLDSTDAAAVRAAEAAIDLPNTLFLVSTKSGGTIETFSLLRHFLGRRPHGDAFVAITDPGSGLEQLAHEHGFRRTFLNDPEIGGRYSALSYFGLVPAALMGADVRGLLDSAGVAEQDCQTFDAPSANSGLWPGLALGELAASGRDKLDLRHRAAARELRAVARAARRRVDRQAGPRDRARRRRAARHGGGLRRRPRDRLLLPCGGARSGACRGGRGAGAGRPAAHRARDGWPGGPRAPVLLLGVRGGDSRLGAGHQPLRPTQRAGGQGRHRACADRRRPRSARRRGGRAAGAARRPGAAVLLRPAGLRRALAPVRRRGRGAARDHPRRHRCGHDLRLRTALPALDRATAQGRPADRALPAGHARRRAGARDPRRRLRLRAPQARPGDRRPRGAARACPARRARDTRGRRRGRRPEGAHRTPAEPAVTAATTEAPPFPNPLADGLERLPIHPTALVIFGATGDLARRKLLAALYNLAHEGALPERLEVVGVSRGEMADDEFRAMAAEAIRRFSRRPPDEAVLRALLEDVRYVAGTFDDDLAYATLADTLAGLDAHAGRRLNRCFYLSTAPTFFPDHRGAAGGARAEPHR